MDALKYLDKIKAWYSNLNDRQLIYAKTFLCAALGNVVATMVITIMHPAAGEIVQNTLITIGVVINVGLVSMSVVVFVAVAAKSAGQLVILETSGIKLLTVGAWKEPDISPDVLIAYRSGETEDEFMSRLQEAANNCGSGKWVLVIPFRYPKGMIYEKPTRYREFPEKTHHFKATIGPTGNVFALLRLILTMNLWAITGVMSIGLCSIFANGHFDKRLTLKKTLAENLKCFSREFAPA